MKKKNVSKLALIADDDMRTKYVLDWALPYESLLNSAIKGDKPQRVFFFVHDEDKETLKNISQPIGFYTPWGPTPPKDMNRDYFAVDTGSPYQAMTYRELLR